jgi:hypothetical protein
MNPHEGNRMKMFVWLGILVLVACAKGPVPVPAPRGTTSSGGGDPYVAEFKDIGRTVVRRFKARYVHEASGVSVATFEAALEQAEVIGVDHPLEKDGVRKDALNYPDLQKIELSLVKWASSMDFYQKRRLVIHEVLGLLRAEDDQYQLTTLILKSPGFSQVMASGFYIEGEVAKVIVEKMIWTPELVRKLVAPKGVETVYVAKLFDPKKNHTCFKLEYEDPQEEIKYRCHLATPLRADLRDNGSIGLVLDVHDPLWNLFESQSDIPWEQRKFDFGVVKGNAKNCPYGRRSGHREPGEVDLELFP